MTDPRARMLKIEVTAQGGKIYELPVRLEQPLFDQILELADKQDYSLSEMVRALTIQGLILRHEREKERMATKKNRLIEDYKLKFDTRGTA